MNLRSFFSRLFGWKSPSRRQLEQLLASLGKTSSEVAETLKRHQCLGYRFSCNLCPVSRFLRQVYPSAKIYMFLSYLEVDDLRIPFEPASPIRAFQIDFGQGKYPFLVQQSR